jgi:hypothetical protein
MKPLSVFSFKFAKMRTAVFSSRYLIFFCICGKLYPVVIEAELEIMAEITDILAYMSRNPKNVRFSDLCKVCEFYFGKPRQEGSSHRVYKAPWQGDPRVNIQDDKGKAKAYQVKQVLKAIERLEVEHGVKK